MKAVLLKELGGPDKLVLDEWPDPQPGPGEVVVAVRAAALNHRDLFITKGQYAKIQLPAILGSDGAGVVSAAGPGVDASWIGREVVINPSLDWGPDPRAQQKSFHILGLPRHGTFAEQVVVPATHVQPKPEDLSWAETAAIPLAGLTAYRALITRAHLQPNETLLVTGIGGGVSSFALQIAKQIGARVIVTSGSDQKLARAKALGADGGVNYRSEDFVKAVQALTEGQGPDVVIDSVGGETFAKAIDAVKPGGRIVNYGATTGAVPSLALTRVFWKQIDILGSTMGTVEEFPPMLSLFGAGGIRPVVDRVYPLAEAAAAHQRMEDAEQFGKIILDVAGGV